MKQAQIIGWGSALPERVLTNDELAPSLNTSSDWIYQRTGQFLGRQTLTNMLSWKDES